MTKQLKDYAKGKIYCIRNTINDDIYIGSTCQSLSQRMTQDRSDFKNEKNQNRKLYVLMNELGKEHFYIEWIEDFPCLHINQLLRREGEVIREYKPSLNKIISGRTKKEYHEDNKDRRKDYYEQTKDQKLEYAHNYYEQNKDKKLEYAKKYREEHQEQIKDKMKTYYEENNEVIKQQKKDYYQQNKEREQARKREYQNNNREKVRERNRQYYERKKQM